MAGFLQFVDHMLGSRRVQLATYDAAFHDESETAVRIAQFLRPEEEAENNQTTRVSMSYRNISLITPW